VKSEKIDEIDGWRLALCLDIFVIVRFLSSPSKIDCDISTIIMKEIFPLVDIFPLSSSSCCIINDHLMPHAC